MRITIISVGKLKERYWKKSVESSDQDAWKTKFPGRTHTKYSDLHGRGDRDHPDHCRLQRLL